MKTDTSTPPPRTTDAGTPTSPPRSTAVGDSVVVGIPAYNEEATIAEIVEEARRYVQHVLVVDDGSTDRTRARAEEAGAITVTHEQNRGYGSALQTIFNEADRRGMEHLVIIDADGQHDPKDIRKLVEAQRKGGAGIVIGSRFAQDARTDVPLYRRFGLSIINFLTNLGLRFAYATPNITDTQSGFRVYDRAAIETMSRHATLSEGMDVSIDILFEAARDGHEIVEIPIDITYDVEDANTHHPVVQGLVLLVSIIKRLYVERPSRLLGIPGALCIIVGGGLAMAILSDQSLTQTVPVVLVVLLLVCGVIISGIAFVWNKPSG